jgi:predicted hydrocarbon binding protein
LIARLGPETAYDILREAGKTAGVQFFENMLEHGLGFDDFIANLQLTLREHKLGILRIEKADLESMSFTLTVAEDLDCSGLPFTDEVVCQYDEGFIAGILEAYTGKPFRVKEVDCWASGDRVCRFNANMLGENK